MIPWFILISIIGACATAMAATPVMPPPTSVPTAATTSSAPASSNAAPSTSVGDDVTFLAPFVYDARAGRRNPFQPPISIGNASSNPMLPGSPLERYDLDAIKLVGIMWNVRHPKAMFVDPGGEVHTLGLDDRIGRKHGYIAAIREGEVVVVEPSQFSGQATYSTRVLHIDQEKSN